MGSSFKVLLHCRKPVSDTVLQPWSHYNTNQKISQCYSMTCNITVKKQTHSCKKTHLFQPVTILSYSCWHFLSSVFKYFPYFSHFKRRFCNIGFIFVTNALRGIVTLYITGFRVLLQKVVTLYLERTPEGDIGRM